MKKIAIALMVLGLGMGMSQSVMAYELGVYGGALTTETDIDADDLSVDGGTGFQVGVLGFTDLTKELYLRSGVLYSTRVFSAEILTLEMDTTLKYLDVPLTIMWAASDIIYLFGGAELSIHIGDECDASIGSCELEDINSLLYGVQVGGHFRFVPNFGVEVSYHYGLADLNDTDPPFDPPTGFAVGAFYLF